ncbi:hypothetical protein OTK49_02605 [Vibrio coralliirubri]|uniref:hypothetical protein n=1 Tax=Vibrio coralliirubri TaxID=1516159 RepID=UPI0022833AC9|nr:hypothetical protein [Vibrio coralliirubri]MCY9861408.1 hypothetical protein [Vibrio coralliirubri]
MSKLKRIELHPTAELLDIKGMLNIEKHAYLKKLIKNKGLVTVQTGDKSGKYRLFISTDGSLCEYANRSTKRGSKVTDHELSLYAYAEIKLSLSQDQRSHNKAATASNIVIKLKNEVLNTTFDNKYIRQIKAADITKSVFENNLTGGCDKDGELFGVNRITKQLAPNNAKLLKNAIDNKLPITVTGEHDGYDIKVELLYNQDNEFCGFLSRYYKNTGHGYEYVLISNKNFVCTDKD